MYCGISDFLERRREKMNKTMEGYAWHDMDEETVKE
jgi:hypothetical protein